MTIGVFGHVVLGMATRKFLDTASKDIGAQGRVTTLVERSGTDAGLVGLLIAFGGTLLPASLDGGKSLVVGGCTERECEKVADDDNGRAGGQMMSGMWLKVECRELLRLDDSR